MTNKNEANTPQRLRMEQRWENARKACGEGSCHANYRFHVQGCTRRDNRKVTIAPEEGQKVKVTRLDTGETSEATILHSDVRAVKDVLDQHEKKAVLLEPLGDDFPQAYWDHTEASWRNNRPRYSHGGETEQVLVPVQQDGPGPGNGVPPARPWWKFWGRRG